MVNYRYIAVEGNIGAGKTTLAHMLSRELNSKLILEEFEENSFLPKFYEDGERYAFPLEMSFLAARFNQLKKHLFEQDLFNNTIVADYIFYKCLIFSKNNLKEDEYDLYLKLFEIINLQIPQPDLLIYLHTPLPKLKRQIQQRGRPYEQNIQDDYLLSIQEGYWDYLNKNSQQRILVIDNSTMDIVNSMEQFERIHKLLYLPFEPGITRVNLENL
jgi:deoxyadenosine/deoxycytidine kinase